MRWLETNLLLYLCMQYHDLISNACPPENVSRRDISPIGIAEYGISEIAEAILNTQFSDMLVLDRKAVQRHDKIPLAFGGNLAHVTRLRSV